MVIKQLDQLGEVGDTFLSGRQLLASSLRALARTRVTRGNQ
jgi:hypothetical protein